MLSEEMYFECHVTTAPKEGELLQRFEEICAQHSFRPAKLLMQKGKPSDLDMFCTARSMSLTDITLRMRALVLELNRSAIPVWRAKIEVAILDEIYVPKNQRI